MVEPVFTHSKIIENNLIPGKAAATAASTAIGAARGLTDESEELNKHTPSVTEIAKKHMTTPKAVHRQINRGVKIEFKHTNDIEVATEIAMDHIGEKLDYYTRLAKVEENFADGKGPGKPGDSQRHGIPKKATISQLEKASHAKGRKGQLARWQLNMRRGKKKANEDGAFPVGINPDGGNLIDRQVAMYPWDIQTPHPKEIDEVADQPYRFISPVSTATAQKSMFQTDSGSTIQVFIQVDTGNGVADIGFFDATDKENPTIGVTGKGDAFRVFATVGSIVKQFVAKRKPPYISFSGKSSDAGRIKLYDMIAKNIGRYLPEYKLIDSGFANGDKGYTFKRVAQESVNENVDLTPEDVYKKNKLENLGISFEEFERYVDQAIQNHSKLYTYWHKFKDHKKSYHLAQQEVLKNLYRNKAYYMSKPVIKRDPIDPSMSDSDWWKNKISEEKKPKKPKTIIDGALKTLIAKGRSEDEAIADLKKEIDGKFYDLTETREGALNWLKSYLPNWPEYVLRDWLYRGLTKHDPGENPKEVVDRSLAGEGMSAQTQWKLIPNFEFKIEKLHPDTQRRINIRAGGSANPMKVPKDAERHATQATLAQQQGGVRKEPVIGKMTPQGFELIEGWHRTIQHFKQFPDGYSGPAWVAMNAVSESLRETTDYSRGEELEGIDIMGAPVFITHHAIERLEEAVPKQIEIPNIMPDGLLIISGHLLERIVQRTLDKDKIGRLFGATVKKFRKELLAAEEGDKFLIKTKSGFGIPLLKTQRPSGTYVYTAKTGHETIYPHPRDIILRIDLNESLEETLKKVKGEWALVSRKNPKKVLQYYHGSGHPSKDWVSKVERRVHSFESIMEDDSVKPRVYLDMDGVLADFFGEWARLAKVDHYKDINNAEENLQLVRDHPTFWVDLPLLPHAKALIKTVIEQYGEYRICSKPLEGDARSKPGKMEWIRKNLSDMMPVDVVLTANKAAFATQDGVPNILVDDFGVNIKSWKAAGGIGIKYDDSAFPQVAKILTSIAKSGVVK